MNRPCEGKSMDSTAVRDANLRTAGGKTRQLRPPGFSRRPRAFTPSRKSLLAMNTFVVSLRMCR